MNAGQLYDVWSTAPTARRLHRVFTGPQLDSVTDAEFHPVVDVYRDEHAGDIIVQHAEESFQLSDGNNTLRGIPCDTFLAKLQLAMAGNVDWPIEASDQGPRRVEVEDDEIYLRADFPICWCGGVEEWEVLLLLW
jgi:hypothetical protein